MRTFGGDAHRSRSLAQLFDEALSLLRQDIADYGFAGLLGAIAAGAAALSFSLAGGDIGRSLVLPAVLLVSLLSYAHAAAAVRRVQEHLEPDSLRAFIAVAVRVPWIVGPAAPPLAITFGAVFTALSLRDRLGAEVAATAAMAVIGAAALLALPLAMRVPALLVRKTSARQAAVRAAETTRELGGALAISFGLALTPAGLLALFALASDFHAVATALAAFAWAATMPVLAAIATLIQDAGTPSIDEARPASHLRRRRSSPVQERLSRHVR